VAGKVTGEKDMPAEMVLEEWSITGLGTILTPPECRCPILQGKVGGGHHPTLGYTKDKTILSSRIKTVEGRKITTLSGSVYRLGRVNPLFSRWCDDKGFFISEEEPIHGKLLDIIKEGV
jgi:hypothetical protein